ncbi:MAG: DUF3179 domain-containing protein [Bacteroidota bacterium]
MKNWSLLFLPLLVFGLSNCGDNSTMTTTISGSGSNSDAEWLIPANEVRDGGPGKDGIPAVNNPNFSPVAEIDFLSSDDLVIVVKSNEEVRAYPHPILDWHEIANDELADGTSLSLTYCPLTGTAIGWNSNLNGVKTTFGVSGLLYNSNLIPYDRATDSYWSQMEHKCVKGELAGEEIETIHLVEMPYSLLQVMYPEAIVMNTETGFSRDYQRYPYGDYRTNHQNIIFPVGNRDERLPSKERVLGVSIFGQAITYRFDAFANEEVNVVQNRFVGTDLVVVGSKDKNFLTAYGRTLEDGTTLQFEAVQNELPIVMRDNEGNEWDMFGHAVKGPRAGEQLPEVLNYIGYWFSWAAFNEGLEIHEE